MPNAPKSLSPTRRRKLLKSAHIALRTGRYADARRDYLQLLAAERDNRDALMGCATAALRLGETQPAVELFRRAAALAPDDVAALASLGNALQAAGRVGDAVVVYRRAIETVPNDAALHFNLGVALKETGDIEAAIDALEHAIALRPEFPDAHVQRGLLLHAAERLDEAIAAFHDALALTPERADAMLARANALYAAGRLDEALVAFDAAEALDPALMAALFDVGKPRHVHARFDAGDPAGALALIDRCLERRPGHSCALALKAIALRESGEHDAARTLIGLDRFVRAEHFAPPDGFADMDAFNAALTAHVRNHPTLVAAPDSYSMHRGKSTGEILSARSDLMTAFAAMIEQAIVRYRKALPPEPGHPFLANRPDAWHMTAWGVILEPGSYQVPHIHPSAWLSGVYYVAIPPEIGRADRDDAGWIEFGQPYWDFRLTEEPETRRIQPKAGMALFFPSFAYHRTLLFEEPGERISIAFDILPGDDASGAR